jgi:hypothetical protein
MHHFSGMDNPEAPMQGIHFMLGDWILEHPPGSQNGN